MKTLNLLDAQLGKLHQAAALLLSAGAILSLPQVLCALTLAVLYLAVRQKRRRGRVRPAVIWRALAHSRRIVLCRSTGADLLYYFVNTFAMSGLIGWGVISAVGISHGVNDLLVARLGARAPCMAPGWALRAGVTLVAFLGYELGYYIDHYLKHKIAFLWAFHKTHHTAEVLTPLTVFRVHPLDTLIFVDVVAVIAGALHGAFMYEAGQPVSILCVDNCNVITLACLFLLAQLQHSQFWMPLRGLAGRLVLSPAHHQLHHSMHPEHYNRNFGSFLAIWDWMFGTLCVPPRRAPRLKFGVAEGVASPHGIFSLLARPVLNALAVVKLWPAPEK